jgi:uroporphyrinogen-III synthase
LPELENKIVAITRSDRDAREFLELVKELGGTAIALPTIEIVPKDLQVAEEFLEKLHEKKYHYCAFMSQQAVSILFGLAHDKVTSALKSTAVIAVGPKTKESLEQHGIEVRLMLKKFSSIGLVELLSEMEPKGKKIILPRSNAANEFATDALIRLGMEVDEVFLYTVSTRSKIEPIWKNFSNLLFQRSVDAVIFTSASNVNSFFEIMAKMSKADVRLDTLTKVVSIGPFTSKALKDRKIECFEAEEHTIRGALQVAKVIV